MTQHEAWNELHKLQLEWVGRGQIDIGKIRESMLQDLRYRRGKPVFAGVVREIKGKLVRLGKCRKVVGK